MKKSNSESYNRIMDYLIKNENISEKEKMFLVKYATKLYANSIENVEKENIGDILSELSRASRRAEAVGGSFLYLTKEVPPHFSGSEFRKGKE